MKFNNISKKSKENLENTLGEREPLGFEDPDGKGSQISKKPNEFGGEDSKSPREPLVAARDEVEEKKRPKVLRGALNPSYIGWKPETRTCPGLEPDMSGKRCLGSSGNFRNYLKNDIQWILM
jgi:hypothetical protein